MYSSDLRWRAVTLDYVYNVPCEQVARLFGVSDRIVRRLHEQFKSDGHVQSRQRSRLSSHSKELLGFAAEARYGSSSALPTVHYLHRVASILCLLKFELNFTRKVLER
ncbi:hypothetical protein PybrP1_006025 [[Pythium] brassicae (nom. inval.)]|nr:hypothetical protein PybrP1_006025 [[Pythium] brassicae (nom. inval.)]